MSENYLQGDPDKGGIVVPFSDDKAEDDTAELFAEDQPGEAPEKRKERLQRRQERIQGMLQSGRKWENRAKELEERDRQRERELAELRGMVQGQQQVRQQQPQSDVDPYKARLDSILERQRRAYASAQAEMKAGTWNDDRQRHYEEEARAIEEEKGTLFAEKVLAQRAPQQQAAQAQQVWASKYPEVYQNPAAYQFAEATFRRRQALGEKVSNDLVDEVMTEAMTTFKLGKKAAPSQSERARMSGLPAGGGGGSTPSTITLTPDMRRMAIAAYDHLSEQDAIKAWVAKTGKKMREKKAI